MHVIFANYGIVVGGSPHITTRCIELAYIKSRDWQPLIIYSEGNQTLVEMKLIACH